MTIYFGPDRDRLGYPEPEWSVLITGMDDIHDQPDVTTALAVAAEHNTGAAAYRAQHADDELLPVTHAIVLRHGYAWTPYAEHKAGHDCGMPQCPQCSPAAASPMTRQQYHVEAARLLATAQSGDLERDASRDRLIAAATAHALLALTAPDEHADDVPGVPR